MNPSWVNAAAQVSLLFSFFGTSLFLSGCAPSDSSAKTSATQPNTNLPNRREVISPFPEGIQDKKIFTDTTIGTTIGDTTSNSNSNTVDDFHYSYASKNSIQGEWQLYLVNSKRPDPAMSSFKDWVENTSNVYFNIIDKQTEDGTPFADMTFFMYSTTKTSSTSSCRISFSYTGFYCCMDMLRVTLEEEPDSLLEQPENCAQNHFGKTAKEVMNTVKDALIESNTSSTPMTYHFIYSKSNNRIKLVNPVPKNKTTSLTDLETEIHLIRTSN
jgi:hypothetical protein